MNIARKLEANLIQEKVNTKRYREELNHAQMKYSRFVSDIDEQFREHLLREEQFKSQISQLQLSEKNIQCQMSEMSRELDLLRDLKRKNELELELLKTNLETTQQRERSQQANLNFIQDHEKVHLMRIEELTKELHSVQKELNRYQSAWGQVSAFHHKAKQIEAEASEMKKKLDELKSSLFEEKRVHLELEENLKNERKRVEELDDVLKKERREKQLALTYLHTAEAKLATTEAKLKRISTDQDNQLMDEDGLELKF